MLAGQTLCSILRVVSERLGEAGLEENLWSVPCYSPCYSSDALIRHTWIGGTGSAENPYANINEVLRRLGVQSNRSLGHHNHFHVNLRPPQPLAVLNLQADDAGANPIEMLESVDSRSAAQALLDQIRLDLDLSEGELTMFVMDMPDLPPQHAQVMIVQASQSQKATGKIDRTIGICQLISNPPNAPREPWTAGNSTSPLTWVGNYLRIIEKRKIGNPEGQVSVLEAPKHGRIQATGHGHFSYIPDANYLGKDRVTFLVETADRKYKVVHFLQVMEGVADSDYEDKELCPKGEIWKISLNPDDPNTAQYTFDYPAQWTSALADTTKVALNIADLSGGAVDQTTANTITLDTDAAGHGWFIDSTPYSNDEFLPTSNPNEWVARPGSAAEGKMDMLSVLLHEYGHTLGLDHSADGHDLMSESLQPGVRHTISSEIYEQLWSLAGESGPFDPRAPLPPSLPLGLPLLFGLGRMRLQGSSEPKGIALPPLEADPNAHTATPTPIYRMQPMYATALHTGLYNGEFGINDPLNAQFGWDARGQVSLIGGEAILSEDERLISGLTQSFVKPEGIVGLGFTLTGAQFGLDPSAPSDAFEMAILDALTGQSVAGAAPLSGTDALLNIQADGRAYGAGSVTVRRQPIAAGSLVSFADPIRVTVDLTTVAAGTTLKLYFDLLGMGARNSNVRIDDVRLLTNFNTEPVAVNDAATTLEDTTVTIPVLANDQDPEADPLAVTLIAGPLHGTLGQNPDGSFTYTPAANFYGTDTFTYKANDGEFDSNVATVTISVTPVNDAPVATNVQASTDEDTALVLDLRTYGSDVDSSALTAAIVTNPANGVLTTNTDGTFTYTPNADFNGADSFTYSVTDGELDSNLATVTLAVTAVNDAPTAANVQISTLEDNAFALDLRTYGADVDSTTLAAQIMTGPANGTLTANLHSTYTYAPNANFNGTDFFTYQVTDGELASNLATVTVGVVSVNDAPQGATPR